MSVFCASVCLEVRTSTRMCMYEWKVGWVAWLGSAQLSSARFRPVPVQFSSVVVVHLRLCGVVFRIEGSGFVIVAVGWETKWYST